jgi:N-methylhydantoinase B
MSILNVKTVDRNGRTVIASIGPVGGGAGGMASADGSDASGANVAFLRNTPVEINEAEVPIRITRYGVVPGSAGAGKYRGGLGTVMEFRVSSPGTLVTARNRDRSRFASWGVLGGKAGAVSRFTRNPGTDGEEDLGVTDLVMCGPGDVIRLEGCGGGGYGDPYERDVQKVLEDVRRGYLSVDQARELYGVVLGAEAGAIAIDKAATLHMRATANTDAQRRPASHFDYGAERNAYEAKWTRERYDVLTGILSRAPVVWRHFLKHKIFDALDAREAAGTLEPGSKVITQLYEEVLQRYPQLLEVEASASA